MRRKARVAIVDRLETWKKNVNRDIVDVLVEFPKTKERGAIKVLSIFSNKHFLVMFFNSDIANDENGERFYCLTPIVNLLF